MARILTLSDLLLLPARRLSGLRRVTTTLRPLRIGFLIDPVDPEGALRAIESCSYIWGGKYQFLIPCTPGDAPTPEWQQFLEWHDPDLIIDAVGANAKFWARQRSWERWVVRWPYPAQSKFMIGALVFSPLRWWMRDIPKEDQLQVLHLGDLTGHPSALPLAFQWGQLSGAPVAKTPIFPAFESTRHEDFVELKSFNCSDLNSSELANLLIQGGPTARNNVVESPAVRTPSLLDLTSLGCRPTSTRHSQQAKRGMVTDLVVVVSDPSSVSDLCLAWNLRACRGHDDPFPFWLDPKLLRDATTVRLIEEELSEYRKRRASAASSKIAFVSTSLSKEELTSLSLLFSEGITIHTNLDGL